MYNVLMAGRKGDDEVARDELGLLLKQVETLHECGLFLPSRTIYLGSESAGDDGESGVDAKMVERFLKNAHFLEGMSRDAITVIMDNVGGDMYHGLAICDAMVQSPCDVRVVVRGCAMSMGSIILQAADERVMGPLATQMVHYGTSGFWGHAKTFEKWAAEERRLNEWMERMYLARIRQRRPGYSLRALRALLAHDTFLTATESIELGLADRVG